MKSILFTLTLLMLSSTYADKGLSPKRTRIFHCRNFGQINEVEQLYIVEAKKGSNTFYEVEVPYKQLDEKKVFFRKLNLISTYEGRVLTFTTGNYRVKIDRALPVEKKYKSFVRLPKFDIHSTEWFCKDY